MLGKKDVVQQLKQKSEGVMSIFTNTVNNLTAINDQAKQEMIARQDKIDALEVEQESLSSTMVENQKSIDKITEFLNS